MVSEQELSLEIKLRDCNTMEFQDDSLCANCYQLIDKRSNFGRKFNGPLTSCDDNSQDPYSITLAQALITVFDLHRKAHLSSILLDETKYSLCDRCFKTFYQLYAFFKEFTNYSSPPSYLFSILKNNPFFEPSYLFVEVKSEPYDRDSCESCEEDGDFSDLNDDSLLDNFDLPIPNESTAADDKPPQRRCKRELNFAEIFNDDEEEAYSDDEEKDPDFDYDEFIISTPILSSHQEKQISSQPKQRSRAKKEKGDTLNLEKEEEEDEAGDEKKNQVKSTKGTRKTRARTHICPECNIGFNRSNHLRSHLKQHSARHHVCECGVGFRTERNIVYHRRYYCRLNKDIQSNDGANEAENSDDDSNSVHGHNDNINEDGDKGDKAQKAEQCAKMKQAAKLVKYAKRIGRPISMNEARSLVCSHELCDKVFSSVYKLKRHEAIHLQKPFICQHCQRCCQTEEALNYHLNHSCREFNKLPDIPELTNGEVGPESSAEYKRRQKILRRLDRKKQNDNNKRYECFCGASFSRTNHLRHHALVHQESNVVCSVCNAGFISQAKLDKHKVIHDPNYVKVRSRTSLNVSPSSSSSMAISDNINCAKSEPPVVRALLKADGQIIKEPKKPKVPKNAKSDCEVCGKSVRTRNMRIHMVSHKTERPAVCEQCGLTFKLYWSLKCHQKYAHGTERPFLCTVCGCRFKRNQHLRDHEIVKHSDARLHVCTVPDCNKTFKSRRNLRQHQALHNGTKFKCPRCIHTFSRKDNLRVHLEKYCDFATSKQQPGQKQEKKPTLTITQQELDFLVAQNQESVLRIQQLRALSSSETATVGSISGVSASVSASPTSQTFDSFSDREKNLSHHHANMVPPTFFNNPNNTCFNAPALAVNNVVHTRPLTRDNDNSNSYFCHENPNSRL